MAQAFSAYDYITQNNRKTWLLVLLFPITLFALVFVACVLVTSTGTPEFLMMGTSYLPQGLQPIQATSVSAALGFTWAFGVPTFFAAIIWMMISYAYGDKMMLSFAGARKASGAREKKLSHAVENVAIMAGLPVPEFYIIEDSSLNAFATGQNPKKAAIAVTTGLIDKLTDVELEGVIAHEMAHIGNRDMRLNMMVITGVGVFGFIGELLLRTRIHSGSRNKDGNQLAILIMMVGFACFIFNFVVAPLLQMALSRTREYAADATGAKIIHNSDALASALQKIAKDARVEALDNTKSMAVACIASPFAKMSGLMSTHPPIEERVRRLKKMG